jgi:hypothetical protein
MTARRRIFGLSEATCGGVCALVAPGKARSTKSETNRNSNAQNSKRFGHSDFVFRACFGFRVSDFVLVVFGGSGEPCSLTIWFGLIRSLAPSPRARRESNGVSHASGRL